MTFEISKPQVAEKTEALHRGAGFNPYRLSSCALALGALRVKSLHQITFKFQRHTTIAGQ